MKASAFQIIMMIMDTLSTMRYSIIRKGTGCSKSKAIPVTGLGGL
jgi:hypothetical protein